MRDDGWRSESVLAWTRQEGPRRPPSAAPRPLMLTLAAALSVVYVGLLFADALCPEHRLWVEAIAGLSLIVGVVAVIALVRDWAAAGLLSVMTACGGVMIGLLDAAHAPTRGRVIALLFAALVGLALTALAADVRLRRWERRELRTATGTLPADISPLEALACSS